MTAIDDARELVAHRLAEIEQERQSIERALTALGGGKSSPRPTRGQGTAAPTAAAPRKRRRRRRGGSRLDQAIELVEKEPGISAGEIAKRMKVKPNYLYRVLGEAEKDGRLKKNGRSYSPRSS